MAIPIVTSRITGRRFRACTSLEMARAKIKTDISGSWGASMTCSTSAATASAPWRLSPRWSRTRRWRKPRWWGVLTILKGQAISAFVTLEQGREPTPELKEELRKWVAKEIGALAKPDDIRFTDTLPKTRSGKIMRRLLARAGHERRSQGRHDHAGRFRRDREAAGAGRSLEAARWPILTSRFLRR